MSSIGKITGTVCRLTHNDGIKRQFLIYKILLPHSFAGFIIRNDFDRANTIAIKRAGKPGFGIEPEIGNLLGVCRGHYPNLIAS